MCHDRSVDVTELVGTVFSGVSALVIEDVADGGDVIVVRAGTRDVAVTCPGCGTETARVHGYHDRTAADVPVDGAASRSGCEPAGCAARPPAARGRRSASRSRACSNAASGPLRG